MEHLKQPCKSKEEEAKQEAVVLEVDVINKQQPTVTDDQQEHRLHKSHTVSAAHLRTASVGDEVGFSIDATKSFNSRTTTKTFIIYERM